LKHAREQYAIIEESMEQAQTAITQIDSLGMVKKKILSDISHIASVKDSMVNTSTMLDNLSRVIPEGINLEDIEYSEHRFKIKGWTNDSQKIKKISSWLTKAGMLKPELQFAKRNDSGRIEFEVMGQIPFFIKTIHDPVEQKTLAENEHS
jgi:Tfp pilus assembly protein PilN